MGMYRSIFKTLKFSSRKTKFYTAAENNTQQKKKSKEHKFRFYQPSMENKSYGYEVLYIHNALQE